jgi:hypothetical protein
MKKALLPIATALLFAAAAVAQSTPQTPTGSQGTDSSSPAMQSGQSGNMSQPSSGNGMNKGEKKMKGCVQSENGQYVLQTKHGKNIPLSGQDVSAHVGHTVTVHGAWAAAGAMSGAATGTAASSGKSFDVTSVDMVSDTCQMSGSMGKKSDSSGNMTNQQPQ